MEPNTATTPAQPAPEKKQRVIVVPSDPDAIVYRRDLQALFGISLCRKRILELEKAGRFPQSTSFAGQATYKVAAIREWINAKFSNPEPRRQVPQPRVVRGAAGRNSREAGNG